MTDEVNQAKGDKSPDQWKPPLTSFYCTYAKSWVQVKSFWALTVTASEKSALQSMLNTCSSSGNGSTGAATNNPVGSAGDRRAVVWKGAVAGWGVALAVGRM